MLGVQNARTNKIRNAKTKNIRNVEKIKSLEKRILYLETKLHLETKLREQSELNPDIQFVSYDGEKPTLCKGMLVIVVNGCIHTLKDVLYCDCECCNMITGKWTLIEDRLPDELKQHADKITKIVNENVEWGCCGGCI